MANRITAAAQQDGTQIWTNRDEDTGDEIRYVFVPKAQLSPGDRVEDSPQFKRRGNGNGLERVTERGRGALSQNDINQLPEGSFLRMREADAEQGQGNNGNGRGRSTSRQ